MTHKTIIWGTYPQRRMEQRGITKDDVRWMLAQGIPRKERTDRGEQRWSRRGYLANRREAIVVYIERATEIELVSVMWVE